MKTLLSISIFISILFASYSCSKDNDLKKSIYVSDSEFNDLPAYSEWGYNTFGAYYDRMPFISNSSEVTAKFIVKNDSTSFVLTGQKGSNHYYNDSGSEKMSMTFKMAGFLPQNYKDLIALNDTILDLSKPTCKTIITIGSTVISAGILEGQLTFNRAQNLIVDNKPVEIILSGYFEFKALINNEPITISEGRFDVGIGYDNFYKY